MSETAEPPGLTAHARSNRMAWNRDSDEYQELHGDQLAVSGGLAWGVWQVPEAELGILGDVAGRDVLELGCGAAQWSIALARRGARPVALDLSDVQLGHARRLMADAGVDFPLLHASAEDEELPGDRLVHDYFGMHRFVEEEYYVEFMLPYGEWIRLFRANGLAIDDLVEIRPPAHAASSYTMKEGFEWARRWPFEHVWRLRKEG